MQENNAIFISGGRSIYVASVSASDIEKWAWQPILALLYSCTRDACLCTLVIDLAVCLYCCSDLSQ